MGAGWRRLAVAGGLRLAALDTLSAALSGLRTQAEALAERYDHEVSLEQQASAACQAADARLAAAVFTGIADPRGYLAAIGQRQAMDDRQTDLLAATQADAIVTRLFSVQAAGLLAQRRAAAQTARFLRAALVAAVSRQAVLVRPGRAPTTAPGSPWRRGPRAGVRLLHWTGYQWVSGPHVPLAIRPAA